MAHRDATKKYVGIWTFDQSLLPRGVTSSAMAIESYVKASNQHVKMLFASTDSYDMNHYLSEVRTYHDEITAMLNIYRQTIPSIAARLTFEQGFPAS